MEGAGLTGKDERNEFSERFRKQFRELFFARLPFLPYSGAKGPGDGGRCVHAVNDLSEDHRYERLPP